MICSGGGGDPSYVVMSLQRTLYNHGQDKVDLKSHPLLSCQVSFVRLVRIGKVSLVS